MKQTAILFLVILASTLIGCSETIVNPPADFRPRGVPQGLPTSFTYHWDAENGTWWTEQAAIQATCQLREITVITDGGVYQIQSYAGNYLTTGDILAGGTIGTLFQPTKNGGNTAFNLDIGVDPGTSAVIGLRIVYVTP